MHIRPLSMLKWVVFIVIALFLVKLFMGYVTSKWPNAVTNAVNTVVQSA